MTRFDVAFLASRIFALWLFLRVIGEGAMILQFLSAGHIQSQSNAMIAYVVFEIIILLGLWFGAEFLARHLFKSMDAAAEKTANVDTWQNAALTVLGFYALYIAVTSAIGFWAGTVTHGFNNLSQEDKQAMSITFAGLGFRFVFALVLIFIPHKLTSGLDNLRTGLTRLKS